LIASVVFSAAAVLVTALTFNGPLAMLGWPGIVLMDQVYSRFGIYVDNSKSLLLMAFAWISDRRCAIHSGHFRCVGIVEGALSEIGDCAVRE
jgi:hypothetical protein